MSRILVIALVLGGAAIGCSDGSASEVGAAGETDGGQPDSGTEQLDSGTEQLDSGTEQPVAMRGWLSAQDPDDLSPDSLGGIRPGVTVRVLDSEPAIEGVSGADGMWFLDVPYGVHMLHAATADHWGAVIGTVFDRGNRYSERSLGLYANLFFEDAAMQLGRPISADLGMVVVFIGGASQGGGESATISAAHDEAFVFLRLAVDAYEVLPQDTLDDNSPDVIFFPNVAPGWTTVSVQPTDGVNACDLEWSVDEIPEWPVVAGSTTNIYVQCHAL